MAQVQKEVGDNFNQKNAEFFFRRVQENLTNITPVEIVKKLSSIYCNINTDSTYQLTLKEYTLVGDLCYIVGLDMTSNIKSFNKIAVENFAKRSEILGLNIPEFGDKFEDVLVVIKPENIIDAKEELKVILTSPVYAKDENKVSLLKSNLKKLFKHFNIPVNFAIGLDEIFNSKIFTYNDVLKLNSLLQNNSTFENNSLKHVITLYKDEFFVSVLQEADKLFQLQKFAVLYFDSILSVMELYNAKPDFVLFFDKDNIEGYDFEGKYPIDNTLDNVEEAEIVEEETTNLSPEVEEETTKFQEKFHPSDVERASKFQDEEPDYFIRSVIEEQLGRNIVTFEDFITGVYKCIENKDFIQYFYQYISANRESKLRKEFSDVWAEFDINEFRDRLKLRINGSRDSYKQLAEKMLQPIDPDKLHSVINYINDCINELVITSGEAKNYLISQLVENQVTTYRQLQQMIGLIEQQNISGSGYYAYVALYNYLYNQTDAKEIFKQSHLTDDKGIEISVLIAIQQFYFGIGHEQQIEPAKEA